MGGGIVGITVLRPPQTGTRWFPCQPPPDAAVSQGGQRSHLMSPLLLCYTRFWTTVGESSDIITLITIKPH